MVSTFPERTKAPKNTLSVAAPFPDNGKTWPHTIDIETGDGELSYPSVIPTATGLATVYTYKRQKIKFWHGSIERIIAGYNLDRLQSEIHHGIRKS